MRALRAALLRWYRAHRRDLPWRRTRDPYAIWISEAMLQQTRVETVLPYYQRFLQRFPDARALATADLDEVLSVWQGLGYYSRARNLRRAAQQLVAEHEGQLPEDADSLRRLPGVGRYTAGAIASIAFDRPEPVLDGNVTRVLARLLGIRAQVNRPEVSEQLWQAAAQLARGPHPGDLNQALMELGATVCLPKQPRCAGCPLTRHCDAYDRGDAAELPRKAPRPPPLPVRAVAALLLRRGKALAVRRPPRGLLGGLWELPGGELVGREGLAAGLVRSLREAVALEVEAISGAGSVEHVFTHRRLRLHLYRCQVQQGRVRRRGFDAHRWLSPDGLRALPQGALTRKALARVLGA